MKKQKPINTPLIKLNIVLEDKIKIEGIYDLGSQVSLIIKKLVKAINNSKDKNKMQLKAISGLSLTKGLKGKKLKIFNIEKEVDVFIVENEDFHDFLIALDIIKEFQLRQDDNLNASQK